MENAYIYRNLQSSKKFDNPKNSGDLPPKEMDEAHPELKQNFIAKNLNLKTFGFAKKQVRPQEQLKIPKFHSLSTFAVTFLIHL